MQQATEIIRVALNPHRQLLESARVLLRCGVLLAVIAGIAGCTEKGQSNGDGGPAQFQGNKSNAMRILRRGLPGEPRTLDPQLAEDTYSFPVLRDLYEGLTAQARNGQIWPGAAELGTFDETCTVYSFPP